jgi:poly(A) polymerase
MEEKKKPTWGVTAAISDAPPTATDNKLNDELIDTLTRMNVFETPEGNKRREEVLAHVQKIVEEFVRRAGKQKGIAQSTLDVAGGKIFFFGSYALGVHGPTSDIDTLIVVPKHVFIEDFFKDFPAIFKEMSDPNDITELVPVEDAFVPIIKMEYRGVSLDLLFASMPTMSSVPKEMETVDTSVLRHLEETTIRSVNGTRVVKELLASVPQRRHFRYALRAVKLWANREYTWPYIYFPTNSRQDAVYTAPSLATPVVSPGPSWSLASASSIRWLVAQRFSPNSSTSCTSGTGHALSC